MLRLALIGDPVEHSLSPQMHNAALAAMNIEGAYLAFRVPFGRVQAQIEELRNLGFRGCNVTIPHKKAAYEIAIPEDEGSRKLGVANTLLFENEVRCKNTDPQGFLEALGAASPGTALVIGAGGAALAAIWALSKEGWSIRVWARNREDAVRACHFPNSRAIPRPDPRGCDLVVNATPVGLRPGEIPPGEWDRLEAHTIVFDMAYRTEPTDLLTLASKGGNPTVDGREMLVAQGALSLEWWTGRPVLRDVMRSAVGL